MPKITIIILSLLSLILMIVPINAAETPKQAMNIPIYNSVGQKIPIDPTSVVYNGTTMVPLRVIAETMGCDVNWQQNKTVLQRDSLQITISPGSRFAQQIVYNEQKLISLPEAPFYKEGTLMIPLRFIAEALAQKVNYCAEKNTDSVFYPVIILGESEYADNLTYEDFRDKRVNVAALQKLQNELAEMHYTLEDLNCILSFFLREPITFYAESYVDSLSIPATDVRQIWSYYISEEALNSQDWQKLLALCRPFHRELYGAAVQFAGDESAISGTYCAELYAGFLTIPLVFDFTLERQSEEWFKQAPENPFVGDSIVDMVNEVGAWKITQISNPRSYINLQALRSCEPEIYNRWVAVNDLMQ